MKIRYSLFISAVGLACSGICSSQIHGQILPAAEWTAKAGSADLADDENGTLTETMRLETIGYRLATANADACTAPVMRTGLVIHDLARYARDQRARIAQAYDVTYGFGILGVVPGSMGDLLGLRSRDEIVAVDGQDLANYQMASLGANATYARTGTFTDFLADKLAQGPVTLLVRRGAERLTLRLVGSPGCGGFVSTIKSGIFNAWSDGKGIAVTTQMINFAKDDSELAFVVAHEMSHNLLGHNANRDRLAALLAMFGPGSAHIRRNEISADQFAIHLLGRTAYDKNGASSLLTRLNRNVLLKFAVDFSHPSLGYRIALAKVAIAREDQARAGAAVVENGAASSDLAVTNWEISSFSPLDWHPKPALEQGAVATNRPGGCALDATIAPLVATLQPHYGPEQSAISGWLRHLTSEPDVATDQPTAILFVPREPGGINDGSRASHDPTCALQM